MSGKINLEYYNKYDIYLNADLQKLAEVSSGDIDVDHNLIKMVEDFYTKYKRKRIVQGFDFDKDADLLEVNASLGVLTEYFCDHVKSVTAIEFALSNAKYIEEKLKDKNNLEIIVGELKNIKLEKKFDYIFIYQTLEASKMFFRDKYPEKVFLEYFKKLLKPNGYIMLVVDNRYGIKEWCGAVNELTGKNLDRLHGYAQDNKFIAFSKPELDTLFNEFFDYVKFYYLSPDVNNSTQVLSDTTLNLFEQKNITDFQRYRYGNTHVHQPSIVQHLLFLNKFDFFVNSFLIVAGNHQPEPELLYSKHLKSSCTRVIQNSGKMYAEKIPLDDYMRNILDRTYKYYLSETKRLQDSNIKNIKLVKSTQKADGRLVFDYAEGERLDLLVYDAVKKRDFDEVERLFREFKDFVYQLYPNQKFMDFTTKGMEMVFGTNALNNVRCVKNANFDINLSNVFKQGDTYTIIDYDKYCSVYLPIDYIVFKSVFSIHSSFSLSDSNIFDPLEYKIFLNMVDNYYASRTRQRYVLGNL